MIDTRKLRALKSIALVAQDSAEAGNLDQGVYADVFAFLSDTLHDLLSETVK